MLDWKIYAYEKEKLNSCWKRGGLLCPGRGGGKWGRKEIGNRIQSRNDSFCSQQTRDDEVHFIPVMDRVFNFFSPGLMYIDSKFLFFFRSTFPPLDIDDITREHS